MNFNCLKVHTSRKSFYSKKNVQAFDGHAKWIWDDKNNKVKQTLYFTKTIDLKKKPRSARLVYTCDDESEFFINGKKVASNSSMVRTCVRKCLQSLSRKEPTSFR